jgi:hypothetical protein
VEQLRAKVPWAEVDPIPIVDQVVLGSMHSSNQGFYWLACESSLRERFCVFAAVLGAIE